MAETCSAFLDGELIARAPLAEVVAAVGQSGLPLHRALVFDDATGEPVRLNGPQDVERALASLHAPVSTAPVSVEAMLLPRHCDWLRRQSGGPSAAIRRLVDAARRDPAHRAREARDAAYRFISMLAGDLAGYEEACRALFAGDLDRFAAAAGSWPRDVRDHGLWLARGGGAS